ncbi:replication protein P [Marinobacterium lutimaris]|uniref:replication protein P n=1 Tax=Marinobacterium lutimaris TaxID=568106 RepID=UPI001EEF75D3|nr:replication protein P [Marinobacterium lutimaris]
MKTADQILGKNGNGLPQRSWTSRTPTGDQGREVRDPRAGYGEREPQEQVIADETKVLVNMIFTRFMAIYGHKFKSCFETEQEIRIAKREWALSLRGYGERELVAAVNRCKETLAWMPTISEFLAIIRDLDGDFGLPPLRDAYTEACMFADHPRAHDWSHPAVYLAGRNTGWFELRSEDEPEVLPKFSYHYDVLCRRVRQGEELELPVVPAIENKQDGTLARFMLSFGEKQGLPPEEACSLLYYLTLPKGSAVRKRLKAQAQEKLDKQGKEIQLPDEPGAIV